MPSTENQAPKGRYGLMAALGLHFSPTAPVDLGTKKARTKLSAGCSSSLWIMSRPLLIIR